MNVSDVGWEADLVRSVENGELVINCPECNEYLYDKESGKWRFVCPSCDVFVANTPCVCGDCAVAANLRAENARLLRVVEAAKRYRRSISLNTWDAQADSVERVSAEMALEAALAAIDKDGE